RGGLGCRPREGRLGKADCRLAWLDTTLALARLRLARRGATAFLAAGCHLRVACTKPAARVLHVITSGDYHGQLLTHIAAHAFDRALCPARTGTAQCGATHTGRAQGEFHRRA